MAVQPEPVGRLGNGKFGRGVFRRRARGDGPERTRGVTRRRRPRAHLDAVAGGHRRGHRDTEFPGQVSGQVSGEVSGEVSARADRAPACRLDRLQRIDRLTVRDPRGCHPEWAREPHRDHHRGGGGRTRNDTKRSDTKRRRPGFADYSGVESRRGPLPGPADSPRG